MVAVLVAACAGLGGWALLRNGTGCRFAAEGACQRVLFIGNSYTYVNDLPGGEGHHDGGMKGRDAAAVLAHPILTLSADEAALPF